MANRTATLYIRITKNGKSSFSKPVYLSKSRLKPQYAMIKGEPEHPAVKVLHSVRSFSKRRIRRGNGHVHPPGKFGITSHGA